ARPRRKTPDHPGLPARVSVLRLPARGTVARLLVPRDASAVLARSGTSRIPFLRPDSGAGERRRSVISSRPPRSRILPLVPTPGHNRGLAGRYHSGLPGGATRCQTGSPTHATTRPTT